jgi:hypothetical protein
VRYITIDFVGRKTRCVGYVYFLLDTNGYIKIGKSRSPSKRILRISKENALPVYPIGLIKSEFYHELEKKLHKLFRERRLGSSEWFVFYEDEIQVLANRFGYRLDTSFLNIKHHSSHTPFDFNGVILTESMNEYKVTAPVKRNIRHVV